VEDAATRERFLGVIQAEASRLSRLLDDLLDLARIQAGVLPYREDPLDLRVLVGEVAGRFRPQAAKGGHHLEVDLPEASLSVRGDADRLGQVIWNLLVNAGKYTPATRGITVRAAAAGPWATVAVEDEGVGIPPEELPHIFDRFYRVDKGRSRQTGGTGLGLPIVKGIVEAHGGRVEATSRVGQGSVFTVYLPLAGEKKE
jgi:signal transduction histidine kinase